MSDDSRELKGIWASLKEIKEAALLADLKWETHIETTARHNALLVQVADTCKDLERILLRGNGQKPVLSQLEQLRESVASLKDEQHQLRLIHNVPTPEEAAEARREAQAEASKARWVAVAKIAGVLILVSPGIMMWLGIGA